MLPLTILGRCHVVISAAFTASRYKRTCGMRSSRAVAPRNAPSAANAATFSNQFAWQTPWYVSIPNPTQATTFVGTFIATAAARLVMSSDGVPRDILSSLRKILSQCPLRKIQTLHGRGRLYRIESPRQGSRVRGPEGDE